MHIPPKMSGTLTLGTRLYDETLTLGGRVTYQGERAVVSKSTSSGGYTASIAWEPYTLVDCSPPTRSTTTPASTCRSTT
ncbi:MULTISPECIES: hypothetical protein [unclassified Ensifer]|uniref:hypothetical protein n=1 Tax=unclassified Ensifer TaxID=2633371 RepID=UPI0008131AD3|nr:MULTISPECIES: hypothetical protein [unclassified Ensifer]OCP22508.1 hypothetical protein BC363_27120 [Ensifer sp. LC384]OCP22930.1 hypothetical protein BC361_23765 [Ensifer sp. LC54]